MSLAAGPIWSAALSGGSFFQFICCLKNESLTAFLSDNFYFRWMDGHSSSEVWRHLFADPAGNCKKALWSVHIFSKHVEAVASRLTYSPKAICHELSLFSLGIWMSENLTCFIYLTQQHPTASIWRKVYNIPSMFYPLTFSDLTLLCRNVLFTLCKNDIDTQVIVFWSSSKLPGIKCLTSVLLRHWCIFSLWAAFIQ